ncbi:GyrI-like domain-containing protein [Radiobacillus deserti]|uniref:GyrI-like domain-containing protein n=1 Tax=Radiobacillus deserti TaxID=2594883 RepID=UPI002B21340A|nr:GyrI-like domain-containing protein [Radiobacillus deserti]
MVTLTVPSQRYAVLRHKGANHRIMNSYEELHKWMEQNNCLRLKEKWHIEKYYRWNDIEHLDMDLLDTIQ